MIDVVSVFPIRLDKVYSTGNGSITQTAVSYCVIGDEVFDTESYSDDELDKAIRAVYKLMIAKLVGSKGVKGWENSIEINKKDGSTVTLDMDVLIDDCDLAQVGGKFLLSTELQIN